MSFPFIFSGGAHCSSNSVGYPLSVLMKGDRGSEGSAERKINYIHNQ
jgi:hypothetical protein